MQRNVFLGSRASINENVIGVHVDFTSIFVAGAEIC